MRLLDRLFGRKAHAELAGGAGPVLPTIDFTCNICGQVNRGVLLGHAENRECQSCRHCLSSLRMRSLMHLLSLELFGKPMTLAEFPQDRQVRGLGMSDWDGYARALAVKFDYVNTYYHAQPRLDISDVGADQFDRYDFLISSDVFEHIPIEGLDAAFRNSRRLLKKGGVFLMTVPYSRAEATCEHFPRLHEFRIVSEAGAPRLVNRTREGIEETFDDLVFHGGEGETLEMRVFGESDLIARLRTAGFSEVRVRGEHFPPYGIVWPIDHSLPIVARA